MKGSRLHAEIMNIGTTGDILGRVEAEAYSTPHAAQLNSIFKALSVLALDDDLYQIIIFAYTVGHRDARHAAAELALKS